MNIRLIKCALLLALCAVNVRGWAAGGMEIFSEDFTDDIGIVQNYKEEYTTSSGWTVFGCEMLNGFLLLNESYAITPALNISNIATAIIKYRAAASNATSLKLKVSVVNGTLVGNDTFNATSQNIKTATVSIINGNETTRIKLESIDEGKNLLIDEIIIRNTFTLSDSESNTTAQTDNVGIISNVTITRAFPKETWCTLCLPFNLTTDKAKEVWGNDVKLRVFSSVEENTMLFTAPISSISAGTPFLLKLGTASSNPTFNGVTISDTDAQTVTKSNYSFIGTYSPTVINETDWFLKADGKLYHPNEAGGNTLKGLRAYFTLPASTAARSTISIANDDGTATVITPSTIHCPQSSETYYTLDGCRVDTPTASGIYIVRQADGTTHKLFIK